MSTFQHAADQAYNALLTLESEAGDNDADQRFFASYLLGHLSLIGADGGDSAGELIQRIDTALEQAFTVDRLSDQDKEGIKSLWQAISADMGRGL